MTRRTVTARAVQTVADPRWAAVVARDAAADDAFVYSVSTTGVYCRPSCGSRAPLPEHVAFFSEPAEARAAGFRPCLRCQPDGPSLAERHTAAVASLARFIESTERPPRLAELAERAGMSPSYTHRLFTAATGLTPRQYASHVQAERARSALTSVGTVTDAIYGAGYASSGRFYEQTPGMLGMKPTQFRAGGEKATIAFAVGETTLGAILVARTERGVCAILFGDDPNELAHELERRFPSAELVGGDAGFEDLVARVVGLVEEPCGGLDLPLDVRGTAFQRRVWEALRAIPVGTTATYQEVAAMIGAPKSVRAVAGACAANHLAVAIPCHRVVRTDGGLSGYRWGVERKRALLEREAACARG